MNYSIINSAILTGRDISASLKDSRFYDYLLGNSVAYYFARKLSSKKTSMDKKIIATGKSLNSKYLKTLRLINRLCKVNGIRFLLFKTYKYIPEVVDNDIDVLLKKKDFFSFLKILRSAGFDCIENEPLKGICKKEGFCIIEPRVDSSFHGLTIMKEDQIWRRVESVNVDGMRFIKPLKELELVHLLLSLLYNPNYLKLYLLLIIKSTNLEKLRSFDLDEHLKSDLNLIIEDLMTDDIADKRFPLFISNVKFIKWWFKRIFPNSKLSLYTRLKHLIYFFYLKYSYVLFNKLVFKHSWIF